MFNGFNDHLCSDFAWLYGSCCLPLRYVFNIPIIKFSLASRYSLYTSFIVALMVGLWLKNYSSYYYSKLILIFLAIVFMIPAHSHYTNLNDHTMHFFSKGIYKKWLPPNSTILMLPFEDAATILTAQQQADFYFKLTIGYTGVSLPVVFAGDPLVMDLISNRPLNPKQFTNFINQYHPNYLFFIGNQGQWKYTFQVLKLKTLYKDKDGTLFKLLN